MKAVLRRTLVGAALATGAALILWLDRRAPHGWVPWAAALLFTLGGARELVRMHAGERRLPAAALLFPAALAALASAPLPALAAHGPSARPRAWYLAAVAASALAAALFAAGARPAGERPGRVALLAVWVVPPLFLWTWLDTRLGMAGMGLLVVLSKVGDVFGYFVGRAIGRRHPFPRTSPNKTVAGCVASLAAGVLAGLAAALLEWPTAWRGGPLGGAAAGLVLNLAAQAGDLAESAVKRQSGVKDSGELFGPSGGVLDVVDSLLLTTPLAILVLPAVL